MSKWNPFAYKAYEIAKSIWAFILPAVVVIAKALVSGDPFNWQLVVTTLVAAITTGGVVFAVPNKTDATPPNPEVPVEPTAEYGAFSVIGILGVVLLIVGLLGILSVLSIGTVISVVLIILGLVLVLLGSGRINL